MASGNISGNISGKQNATGIVNSPTKVISYTGKETSTSNTVVDNDNRTIAVNVNIDKVTENCAKKWQINELNETKVDKESGKGLSTNDFTNAEKSKLSGIEAGAQVNPANYLESASVNGNVLTITPNVGQSIIFTGGKDFGFPILNSSDINIDNLTDEQIEIMKKGCVIKNTTNFLDYSQDIVLFPAFEYNDSYIFTLISGGAIESAVLEYLNRKIRRSEYNEISINKVYSFNGKDIPAYPTSPTNNKVLTYNKNNTLTWEDNASDLSNYYTKSETDVLLDDKQDTLVSGTNIKTVNGNSILGSGDISVVGPEGPQGPQGEPGPAGRDGLTTSIYVNDETYTQIEGTITLPNYPDISTKQDTLVSGENIKTINNQSLLGSGNISIEASQNLVETTWSELKELRDNDELISGCFYRITDYQCTTIQYNTSSATNQFDIIVLALSTSTLSEDAYAINHESNESGYEDYFANSNLSAWKLKYCLNNDLSRFAWARTNGIVVNNSNYYRYNDYYDDVGASHPYCWLKNNNKNYKFWTDTESVSVGDAVYSNSNSATPTSTVISIIEEGKGVIYWMKDEFNNEAPYDFKNFLYTTTSAYGNYTNAYTFSYTENGELKDASLLKDKKCCNNVIKSNGGTVLIVSDTTTFNSYNNVFEKECANVILKSGCSRNIFKMNCMNIQFGANCTGNFISSYCQNSVFGNSCVYNIIGNHSFFEFGNNCEGNITGNVCTVNLGNYCSYNKVGNHCAFTLGTSSSNKINYCRYITVDNGCRYLHINSEDTASSSKYLQNIHIHSGTYGTSTGTTTTYKTVVVSRNLSYTTDVYATGSTEIFI